MIQEPKEEGILLQLGFMAVPMKNGSLACYNNRTFAIRRIESFLDALLWTQIIWKVLSYDCTWSGFQSLVVMLCSVLKVALLQNH